MKSLWQEFKAFAFKGNMIDLAIAVVIGAAFSNVIKSLVDNLFMPLISYVTPSKTYEEWHLGKILIGKFIGDMVSFLIVALAVFLVMVKVLGAIRKFGASAPAPAEPTTKECPLCLSVIPIKARRCSHCTADLAMDSNGMTAKV